MVITEIKVVPRASTSTPFYNQIVPVPEILAGVSVQTRAMVEAGEISSLVSVISEDGLFQTNTRSFYSLEAYSKVDSLFGIQLEHALMEASEGTDGMVTREQQYKQTGIDVPFACTTTYTYPENVLELYPLFNSFVNIVEYSDKLEEFVNTGTQLIATHHYDNSEDFTKNHWYDARYLEGMFTGQMFRTISYALL